MSKSRNRTPLKSWLSLIVSLLVTVGLIFATEPEPQAALQEQWTVQVDLVAAKRSSMFPVERAVGRLKPARRASLSFEVPGRVVSRLVEPGASVSEGQPLLQLDDADARDRFDEAEAQYELEKESKERDRELLKLAQRNTVLQRAEVERLKTLKAKSLTSGSQLDAAQQTQLQLQAEQARLHHAVRTAPARLALTATHRDQALRQLERTTLRAPFTGIVNRVEVDVGDYVSMNQTVVELVDLDSLDLYVEVRGEAVEDLKLGLTLMVTVNERELSGRLHAIQYDPDPSTHTHALRVRLSGWQARPGTLATVELPRTSFKDVLVIPVPAILSTNGETFVFYYADGVLSRRPVILGPRVGDMQVVQDGLMEGDRIVARDVAGLSDGQFVEKTSGSG